MPDGEQPERKVTVLPEWRGDCDEHQIEVIRVHPWARKISGFED